MWQSGEREKCLSKIFYSDGHFTPEICNNIPGYFHANGDSVNIC